MSWSRGNLASRSIRSGATVVALVPLYLLGFTTASRAQGMGADPFRPYNAQYDAFVFPIAPGPMDAGFNNGMPRQGIRGANQFENYLNSLQGTGSHAGAGTPYYKANRAYDREFNRDYRPNREADKGFDTNQELVTELYFRYLREKDPQKRAEIFRDYNRARSRADRDLAAPRTARRSPATLPARRAPPALGSEPTGTRGRENPLGTAPSPVGSDRRRARASGSRAGVGSSIAPAPSALGEDSPEVGSPAGLSPSQVLDRATRPARLRVGPRSGRGPRPADHALTIRPGGESPPTGRQARPTRS